MDTKAIIKAGFDLEVLRSNMIWNNGKGVRAYKKAVREINLAIIMAKDPAEMKKYLAVGIAARMEALEKHAPAMYAKVYGA